MTEPEHAERCDIIYQLQRMAKGLNPNWGNSSEPQYGYEKMDNSLTDHRIAIQKQMDEVQKIDLSEIPEEDWQKLPNDVKFLHAKQREQQVAQKNRKNDEKQKNDENAKKSNDEKLALLADLIVEKSDPTPTPIPTKKSSQKQS